uniref:Peptidase S1 domain-containing protein n=1 Tax=Rhabditophanes sp. KR3021 TaxID=114890 RepID=A0AC35TY93_9BILA
MKSLCVVLTFLAFGTDCSANKYTKKLPYYNYEYCEGEQLKSQNYIFGGEQITDVETTPWNIFIVKNKGNDTNYKQTCTGTLISRKHVLTAQHCFQKDDLKSRIARFRFIVNIFCESDTEKDSDCISRQVKSARKAKSFYFDSNFNENELLETAGNDYVIIELDEEVPIRKHACLPFLHERDVKNVKPLTAYGYGKSLNKDMETQYDMKLRKYIYNDPYVLYSKCEAGKHLKNLISIFLPKTGGVCSGDSGGSLGFFTDGQRFNIIGVSSFVLGGCVFSATFSSFLKYFPGTATNHFAQVDCFSQQIYDFMLKASP